MLVHRLTKQLMTIPFLLDLEGDINTFPRLEIILNSSDPNSDKDDSYIEVDFNFDIITKSRNRSECLKIERDVKQAIIYMKYEWIVVNMLNFGQTNYPGEQTDDMIIHRAILNPIFTISQK